MLWDDTERLKIKSQGLAAPTSARLFRLSIKVHLESFRAAPREYIRTALWRVRGLRIRSRFHFARLAGQTPSAYSLWIARKARQPRPTPATGSLPTIQPVIVCRQGSQHLEQTLASLADHGWPTALLVAPGRTGNISRACLGEALGQLHGDAWLLLMDPGDKVHRDAHSLYSAAISRWPSAAIIYADDDLLDCSGLRTQPHFKPNWNPELFEHHDFLTGAAIIKAAALREEVAPDLASLVRRALSQSENSPHHIAHVLHHRRSRPQPVALSSTVAEQMPDPPLVSVIIPTRNKVDLLKLSVSAVEGAAYPALEKIIIDNGSDDPETKRFLLDREKAGWIILRDAGPFNFSALNNHAVSKASGDLLLFLNNDIEAHGEPDWIQWLVRQAIRPDIGAVGAKLLYPDLTIQHAGVVVGMGGAAGHAHRFLPENSEGYFRRHALPQRATAVTAACLVVERFKFEKVGGFDEQAFPVAFNDVDLCLRLGAHGWHSFYEPRASLIHHESKSRGLDSAPANRDRFAAELKALKDRWNTETFDDPFHHPHLSRFSEQFVIAVDS